MQNTGINYKKILVFIGLAYAVSWAVAWFFYVNYGNWHSRTAFVFGMLFMMGPAAAALLTSLVFFRESVKERFRFSLRINSWFYWAFLLPFVISALAFVAGVVLVPGTSFSPDLNGLYERLSGYLPPEFITRMKADQNKLSISPVLLMIIKGAIGGATLNALLALGEEIGWRGFLERELESLGFFRPALIIGFIWGVWHAPIILMGHNYPIHPVAGVFFMTAFCMMYSPLFTLVTRRSNSVLAAAVLHGCLNGSAGLAFVLIKGGTDLEVGLTGAAGIGVLAAVNLALYFVPSLRRLWAEPADRGESPATSA